MNITGALHLASNSFRDYGSDESVLEARVLLKSVMNLSTTSLFISPETTLTQQQCELLDRLIDLRLHSKPVAYLTNIKEFYGITFFVDPRVLIPRPETELIVDRSLSYIKNRNDHISAKHPVMVADIGTGCGNIALSIALNTDNVSIYGIDISNEALQVANINVRNYGMHNIINLRQGDLTDTLTKPIDLLVANLPYICSHDIPKLPREINLYEPKLALDGGNDGLDLIKRLLQQLPNIITHNGKAILEIGLGQNEVLSHYIKAFLPGIRPCFFRDLSDVARVVELSF